MMCAMKAGYGERIRKQRQRLGLRQHELAALVGVDRTAVSNWEREVHFPDRYEGKLEQVLGIPIDEGGTQGLPRLVADNSDYYVVTTIWGHEEMTAAERLGLIRDWLRRNHPERLGDAEEPAG
jgi:transcriptional regulator with XRE-family HTH domain